MTLGDELLLLAIDPHGGRIRVARRLGIALRLAELLDLVQAGRIEVLPGTGVVNVRDTTRTADRRLSNTLRRLRSSSPAPTVATWIASTPPGLVREYLSRLEDQKAVRVDRGTSRQPRVPPGVELRDRARQSALRQRVVGVARGEGSGADGGEAEQSAFALAVLTHACGLDARLFHGPRGWMIRRRLARLQGRQPLTGSTGADAAPVGDGESPPVPARVLPFAFTDAAWQMVSVLQVARDIDVWSVTYGSEGTHRHDPASGHHGGGHFGGGDHGGHGSHGGFGDSGGFGSGGHTGGHN